MSTPDADPSATLEAELAKAKRIADGLQFACRLPDRKPDFFACGGPAAEAYWDYFTPARIVSLLAAIEAPLKLADDWMSTPWPEDGGDRAGVATEQIILDGTSLREAITRALNGESSDTSR